VVDAAMVDGASLLMTAIYGLLHHGLWRRERGTNVIDGAAPFYDAYRCADGGYVAVGAIEPRFYAELLERLGLAEEDLPPQNDRAGWPRLRARLAEVFATRTRGEWADVFAGSDACVTPVHDLIQAAGHPHLRARGTLPSVDGVLQPAPAPRFSRTPGTIGPAEPGGPEALVRWGLPAAEVERLRSMGVVG
jgi:alpha-methylacyl-CoA racemase